MAKQTVPLYTVTSGDRVERARTSLAEALGGASLGDPNDAGIFDVSVDAQTPEEAREMVREAFARAGTGDDFVIQETTEGRELADDDPRQGVDETEAEGVAETEAEAESGSAEEAGASAEAGGGAGGNGDRASLVADAASAVAAAASSDAADSARAAASSVADSARDAASSVRDAVDEKGVGGAASDYASTATQAAQGRDWSRFAPIGGLLLLLMFLRRRRR